MGWVSSFFSLQGGWPKRGGRQRPPLFSLAVVNDPLGEGRGDLYLFSLPPFFDSNVRPQGIVPKKDLTLFFFPHYTDEAQKRGRQNPFFPSSTPKRRSPRRKGRPCCPFPPSPLQSRGFKRKEVSRLPPPPPRWPVETLFPIMEEGISLEFSPPTFSLRKVNKKNREKAIFPPSFFSISDDREEEGDNAGFSPFPLSVIESIFAEPSFP